MIRRPSLGASSVLNFTDGAISLLSALAVSVMLARTLHPQGFGVYALVMSIVSFAYLFARAGIPGTVRRYAAELDGRGDRHLIGLVAGNGLRNAAVIALAAGVLLALAAAPLSAFFGEPSLRAYLLIGAGLVVPMVPLSVLRGLLGGLQQYRYLMLVNLCTSPAWLAGCGIALVSGGGIAGVLLVTLAVEVLNLVLLSVKAVQLVTFAYEFRLASDLGRRVRRYNVTLAALILLDLIVWQRSELLFLGRLSTATQVSFYAVPFALTERVADLIPGAVLGVLLPALAFASADGARVRAVFGDALRHLAILTVPIVIGGIAVAPFAMSLLYGPGFEPAAVVLQILFVSVMFGVLGQASRSMLLALPGERWLLKTGIVAAAMSVLLDLALIPRWGALGAAVANTTVQAAWSLTMFLPLRAHARHQTPAIREVAASS